MRNRVKTATPNTRRHIAEAAEDVEVPDVVDVVDEVDTDDVDDVDGESSEESEGFDDSWLDGLTPLQAENTEPPQSTPRNDEPSTEEQEENLRKLYEQFEHIDPEVVEEVDNKLFRPKLSKVEAELEAVKRQLEQRQRAEMDGVLARTNKAIFEKHQKADRILQSKEFMDFVNAGSNPYAQDRGFDILMRAYYAGDADYVIRELDKFKESRGKPKPPVGVEPQQGGGQSGVSPKQQKKPMTEAEYLAKRRAIRAAPRGTYPPGALANLVEEYRNSRG